MNPNNCTIFKFIFLVLVLLLVYFSFENTKVIRNNYEEVKQISEMLNTLIIQPNPNELATP